MRVRTRKYIIFVLKCFKIVKRLYNGIGVQYF